MSAPVFTDFTLEQTVYVKDKGSQQRKVRQNINKRERARGKQARFLYNEILRKNKFDMIKDVCMCPIEEEKNRYNLAWKLLYERIKKKFKALQSYMT